MAVGRAKAHDEQVGVVLVALYLQVWHLDVSDFLEAQVIHLVMVLGFSGDSTGLAVLFQSTEDMCVALLSGDGPVAHLVFRVALIRRVFVFLFRCDVVGMYRRHLLDVGQTPCRRTVGDEGVGEEHHWREMLQCDLGSHIGSVEAVGGAGGGDDRHRALTVAAVEHLQQVGLLALCWQACRWSATLHVDDDERQLVDDSEVDGLALQADAGAGGGRHSQCTGKGSTDST